MARNVAQKLIATHLLEGEMRPGAEIALAIDQTLTQDATGTLVMLMLEALDLDRVKTEASVQYVDHNLLQTDHRNAEDHLFLSSACRRFGLWFSPPGNGVSHPVHMERFGKPGRTLLGSDSHTCAAGALGMLAIGAGGADVAAAMAGEPLHLRMPEIWGVRLINELPEWVSAKDVILTMLRRHGVAAGIGRIVEYHGPGVASLTAMDRHVIANMGAELGATSTVFPSDAATRTFLAAQQRAGDWSELAADEDAGYDFDDEIDLADIEPLIATPSSPGNVVPVRELAGEALHQAYIGSSANPGYRDFAVVALMLRDRHVHPAVSFDVNPASSQVLQALSRSGHLTALIAAGARLHQTGCNGCIGMGQAPATGRNSLRTVPRNFPGRSGTREDSIFLCSPETATASALTGRITDPRTLDMPCPNVCVPPETSVEAAALLPPIPEHKARVAPLVKGDNIASLPQLDPLPERLVLPVLLKLGDDLSTDEILPAGNATLPYRSNIPKISAFTFAAVDADYPRRAAELRDAGGHAVVAGENYGQGSSREHAALAPRYLGLRAVLAKSFARIHRQNLINYGVVPLRFADPDDIDRIRQDETLEVDGLHALLAAEDACDIRLRTAPSRRITVRVELSHHERDVLLAGGMANWLNRNRGRSLRTRFDRGEQET